MWISIVRPGRGFRVVLHCKNRKCFVANTFHRSIVQIQVRHREIGRPGHPIRATLERKTVILRGNQDFASHPVLNRMIAAAVAIRQLDRLAPEGQPQQLMPEADPEGGQTRLRQGADRRRGVAHRLRIPGAIGQEQSIWLEGQDFRRRGGSRNHRDPAPTSIATIFRFIPKS